MDEFIAKAVLIALNTEPAGAAYDSVYGGETLLNRALIALSKSDIRVVKIICHNSQREKIALMIDSVRKRISLECEISELESCEILSEKISHVVEKWDDLFLLFETDKIVHPTVFAQAVKFTSSQNPLLFAYKNVWLHDGQVAFAVSFTEKFKVIFKNLSAFAKIALSKNVFQNATFDLGTSNSVEISPDLKNGIISTDIAVCRRSDLQNMAGKNFTEMIQRWNEKKLLALGFVEKAWWLKVTGKETKEQIREFFWQIAFKEISGEFSKLVNAKFSKPLTFLFVRLGFSPNAISIIELILFLVSSAFLLINQYWAMVAFAIIWQFAAGVLDRCDGETARVRNYESEAGARFDMVIDDLRFGAPFVFLTIACYREFHLDLTYVVVAAATFAWYFTAVIFHNRFLRQTGYVSIQAMGVDFLQTQEESAWFKIFRRIQPFTKGDIRTFYIFLLAFLGHKNVLFWMLVAYAWPLGASYFFTIKKFRLPSEKVQSRTGGCCLNGPPTVWVLTDDHPGNTTQSMGLVKALGWPYEVKELHFTPLVHLHDGLFGAFGATRIGLNRTHSASLAPPWPDLVITTGWRTEHVARWIHKQSRGHTRLVQLGRKGGRVAALFDLVVSCTYFRLPPHPRRIETTAPLTQVTPEQLAQAAERWQGLFDNAPHPRIALLVGGTSSLHRLDAETARRIGEEVSAFAQAAGGSVFATTSRRTGQEAAEALRRGLGESSYVHLWQPGQQDNPYLAYLALADVLVVTGESESMLAEAAATGKPIYIYPLPKRQPGLWIRLKEWVVARSQLERLNACGTVRLQQGLAYLCARLVERGIILPQQDLQVLHQTLVCRGSARFFGEPLDTANRPVLREIDEVVRRVRALMGMSEEQGPHSYSSIIAKACGTAEKVHGLD